MSPPDPPHLRLHDGEEPTPPDRPPAASGQVGDALPRVLADRYAVEGTVGAGGMATVFLVRDIKHDRQVALKLLKPELVPSHGPGRFLREVRIAAQLNHPNILTLIDSGEAGAFFYYVMPFVEGGSLRERLEREDRFEIDESIEIAEQVARALDFAHRRGVVHRDVKPENILFHEGQPMVADFGIALGLNSDKGARLTEAGTIMGTPAYMSPEQINADRALDVRSDVYSLACVLFEMLTGEPPHNAPSAHAMMAHRLTQPPPSAREIRSGISAELEDVVLGALARDPSDRTPSAAVFAESLARARRAAAVGQMSNIEEIFEHAPAPEKSIAVLPFSNLSPDPDDEYFTDGITDELINALAKVRDLKVTARTSAFAFKGAQKDVRDIGGRLGVRSVLEGGVRRAGARLRVTAQLVDVERGHPVWSAKYDREVEDLFQIQDDISASIVSALKTELGVAGPSRATTTSVNLEAYEAYLRGRFLGGKGTLDAALESIELYERSVELAPEFAAPYGGMAMSYYYLTMIEASPAEELHPKLRRAAERALELDDSIGEAHMALALTRMSYDFDWSGADAEFRRAIALDPGSSMTHHMYGQFLANTGRSTEAVTSLRRAVELDPLNAAAIQTLGWSLYLAGRIDDALELQLRALQLEPNHIFGICVVGVCHAAKRRYSEAVEALEKGLEISGAAAIFLSCLATVEAQSGRVARARERLAKLKEMATHSYVSGVYLAWPAIALGDVDEAFRWLDLAVEQRAAQLITLPTFLLWDPIRADPRFETVRQRLGFDEPVGNDTP